MVRRLLSLLFFLTVYVWSCIPAYADIPGERRYNFVTHQLEFYDGSGWYNFGLGLSLGACTQEGSMEFNDLLSLYQYCDGTLWIRLVGIPTLSGCATKAEMDYFSDSYFYCNGLVWVNMKGPPVS
jgi:hypothetical protein